MKRRIFFFICHREFEFKPLISGENTQTSPPPCNLNIERFRSLFSELLHVHVFILHLMFVSSFSFFLFFFFFFFLASKTFYPSPTLTGNPHFVEWWIHRSRVDREIIDVITAFYLYLFNGCGYLNLTTGKYTWSTKTSKIPLKLTLTLT